MGWDAWKLLQQGLAGLVLVWPASAAAHGQYEADIPNGNCIHCHAANNTLDAFGSVVRTQMQTGGTIRWATLYSLDSDGDGYSNGEELGDPCGVWVRGGTPRFTNGITQPGSGGSVPTMHTVSLCVAVSSSVGGSSSRASSSSSRVSSSAASAGSSTGGVSLVSSAPLSSSAANPGTSMDPASSAVAGSSLDASGSSSTGGGTVDVPGCGGNHTAGGPALPAWGLWALGVALLGRRRR